MTGLAEWLLTQISEDERVAQACIDAIGGGRAGEPYDDGSGDRDSDDFPSYPWGSGAAELAFMALAQPARVLAECAAKRVIVKLHEPMSVLPGNEWFNDAHLTSEPMRLCRSCEPERMFRREKSYPCRTIRALAAPYSDRPGFREEWRA